MDVEINDYKISYLELVGEMYTGAGLMMIIKYKDVIYESLFWVSPIKDIKDRLILPVSFIKMKGIDKIVDLQEYDELVNEVWRILPFTREAIFNEINK